MAQYTDPTGCALNVTCTSCVTRTYRKRKHDWFSELVCVSFQNFGLSNHLHTELKYEQYATHSTQIKLMYSLLLAAPRVSIHTNSDFIHKLIAVQLRNGCHVWRWWFSSPVYYAFLCRSCVCFFNKENKKISFLDWYVIFSKADTSTNNIHKHGMYTFTNRRQGKAVNVFGHDWILTNVTWHENEEWRIVQ